MRKSSKKIGGMIRGITEQMGRYYLTYEADRETCLTAFEESYRKRGHDDLEAVEIRDLLGDDLTWRFIVLSSEVEVTDDTSPQGNEINSFIPGDCEYRIGLEDFPELKAALLAKGCTDDHIFVYGRPRGRLILKLDPVEFLKIASAELTARLKRKDSHF